MNVRRGRSEPSRTAARPASAPPARTSTSPARSWRRPPSSTARPTASPRQWVRGRRRQSARSRLSLKLEVSWPRPTRSMRACGAARRHARAQSQGAPPEALEELQEIGAAARPSWPSAPPAMSSAAKTAASSRRSGGGRRSRAPSSGRETEIERISEADPALARRLPSSPRSRPWKIAAVTLPANFAELGSCTAKQAADDRRPGSDRAAKRRDRRATPHQGRARRPAHRLTWPPSPQRCEMDLRSARP